MCCAALLCIAAGLVDAATCGNTGSNQFSPRLSVCAGQGPHVCSRAQFPSIAARAAYPLRSKYSASAPSIDLFYNASARADSTCSAHISSSRSSHASAVAFNVHDGATRIYDDQCLVVDAARVRLVLEEPLAVLVNDHPDADLEKCVCHLPGVRATGLSSSQAARVRGIRLSISGSKRFMLHSMDVTGCQLEYIFGGARDTLPIRAGEVFETHIVLVSETDWAVYAIMIIIAACISALLYYAWVQASAPAQEVRAWRMRPTATRAVSPRAPSGRLQPMHGGVKVGIDGAAQNTEFESDDEDFNDPSSADEAIGMLSPKPNASFAEQRFVMRNRDTEGL
jgi:hypothetical protein